MKADIEHWAAGGLIDRATAGRLAADIDARPDGGFSLGYVIAIMASLLLGAAILLFVSANWEAIPRLLRVGLLFVVIAGSYVGGAVAKTKDHAGYGEALYLLGCLTFGASMALIGQMYHTNGDELLALLVWCLTTIAAAALLRSPTLTIAAILLAIAWFGMGMEWSRYEAINWYYLPLAALLWLLSYWSGSIAARHLILLSLLGFVVFVGGWYIERGEYNFTEVGAIIASAYALLFVIAYVFPDAIERVTRFGGEYPVHTLLGFLAGMSIMQADILVGSDLSVWPNIVSLAAVLAALLLRGRRSRLMRWLAYLAFAYQLCLLYYQTIGTMLDTSALFLVFGLILAVLAWFISRFEKRMRATPGAAA